MKFKAIKSIKGIKVGTIFESDGDDYLVEIDEEDGLCLNLLDYHYFEPLDQPRFKEGDKVVSRTTIKSRKVRKGWNGKVYSVSEDGNKVRVCNGKYVSRWMKSIHFFHNLLDTVETYEVGDWVKLVDNLPLYWANTMNKYLGNIVRITDIYNKRWNFDFEESDGWLFRLSTDIDRLATVDEIKNHLLKEAVKQGFVGKVEYTPLDSSNKRTYTFNDVLNGWIYDSHNDRLGKVGVGYIYQNGQWSSIHQANMKEKVKCRREDWYTIVNLSNGPHIDYFIGNIGDTFLKDGSKRSSDMWYCSNLTKVHGRCFPPSCLRQATMKEIEKACKKFGIECEFDVDAHIIDAWPYAAYCTMSPIHYTGQPDDWPVTIITSTASE